MGCCVGKEERTTATALVGQSRPADIHVSRNAFESTVPIQQDFKRQISTIYVDQVKSSQPERMHPIEAEASIPVEPPVLTRERDVSVPFFPTSSPAKTSETEQITETASRVTKRDSGKNDEKLKLIHGDSSEVFVALHDYTARTPQDLSLVPGQEVRVLSKRKSQWWYVENASAVAGYVPSAFLVPASSIERFPWYHGCLERTKAVNLLMRHPKGTFLVRESESNAGEYSLSVRDSSSVKHYRIRCASSGLCYISSPYTFPSIDALVSAYSTEPHGICCLLGKPCQRVTRTSDLDHSTAENWEVGWDSLVMQGQLGQGEFGEVWYAKWKGITPVAVKLLKPNAANRDEFLKEVAVLKLLHHECLITLYAVISTSVPLAMITEYMPKGTLLQLLRSGTDLSSQLLPIAVQIADGLAYLESKNVIHRDLAARNVLVGEDFQCKVADFGLARLVKSVYENCNGVYNPRSASVLPVRWTAPETFLYNSYTIKGDVWSFGILMVEMVTRGALPYPKMSNSEVVEQVIKGYRLPKPSTCTDELYDVMLKCWCQDPQQRPRFEQLYLGFSSDQCNAFDQCSSPVEC